MNTLVPTDRINRSILLDQHDAKIREIFDAIRALLAPPGGGAKRRIGFRPRPD